MRKNREWVNPPGGWTDTLLSWALTRLVSGFFALGGEQWYFNLDFGIGVLMLVEISPSTPNSFWNIIFPPIKLENISLALPLLSGGDILHSPKKVQKPYTFWILVHKCSIILIDQIPLSRLLDNVEDLKSSLSRNREEKHRPIMYQNPYTY